MQRQSRALFDWLARASGTRRASIVMLAWAFAEAIFWPIIPDALLSPLVVARPQAALRLVIFSIVGSALGGATLYLFAFSQPDAASALLGKLPLVFDWQIAQVRINLEASGPAGYWSQPISGIPFKAWGIIGGVLGLNPWQAIPTFVAARSLRMIGTAVVSALLGGPLHGFIRDHAMPFTLAYIAVFGAGWLLTMIAR